ncbi:MAG: M56 family metallopeptidase, partial [Bacteroidota bacterium]
SLVYTQHLRHYKTHNPSAYWKDKIVQLRDQLHITKAVELLESEIIKVPAVFGHLKPVIFIPLGILANLPPHQVEAVLLHELAHIRRNDYLFNLIQNIVETVFFFNPALLWLSSIIREERENCCDDIAIAQTKNKKQFIESLIRFKELYIYNDSKYVTAFPGNKNSFVNRITRIAMNKNKSLNPAENVFLAISLVIISTLVMAFCEIKQPAPPKSIAEPHAPLTPKAPVPVPVPPTDAAVIATATSEIAVTDTVPKSKKSVQRSESSYQLDNGDYRVIYSDIDKSAGKETIVLKTDGNEYKLVKLNGELAYLVVNDEKIPKEKMGDYSDLLKKINAQLERMKEEQEIRDKEQAIRDKEQEQRNAEQEIRNKEQAQRDIEQEIRNKEQAQRNEEQEKRNTQQLQQNQEQKKRDAEQDIRNKEQAQRDAEQVIRNKEQAQRDAEQVIRNKEQAQRDAELKKLIDDLVSDKIITEKKSLRSFTLDDDEFIVNGVKQSPEVSKKYKTKYLKLSGGTYNYRNN